MFVGTEPNNELVKDLVKCTEKGGWVVANSNMETSVPASSSPATCATRPCARSSPPLPTARSRHVRLQVHRRELLAFPSNRTKSREPRFIGSRDFCVRRRSTKRERQTFFVCLSPCCLRIPRLFRIKAPWAAHAPRFFPPEPSGTETCGVRLRSVCGGRKKILCFILILARKYQHSFRAAELLGNPLRSAF